MGTYLCAQLQKLCPSTQGRVLDLEGHGYDPQGRQLPDACTPSYQYHLEFLS